MHKNEGTEGTEKSCRFLMIDWLIVEKGKFGIE